MPDRPRSHAAGPGYAKSNRSCDGSSWSPPGTLARRARQAGRDLGVRIEYQAPESFDMVTMAQLIDAAVASQPDGLVVSMPDADALGPAVREAIDAGMPLQICTAGHLLITTAMATRICSCS